MFNEYPYVNLQDINLDWILKHIKDLETNLQDFIKLNTIKYADPIDWNISKQYEANTVVVNDFTGVAYLSTQPVPSGVDVTNTDYWTPIFTLDFVNLNKNITLRNDGNNNNATFASVIGDWLIVGGQLYKVIQDISLHTAYVVGYNIQVYSVEMFVRDYLNQVLNLIGDLQDLTTSDKTSVVNAINALVDNIGDLQDLTTSDKTSVVNAINTLVENIGDLDDLTTSDKTSVVNAINTLVENIGDLQDLTTSDKTSVVNAINNVNSDLSDLTNRMDSSKIVDPDQFSGTDAEKLQAAINYSIASYYPSIRIEREFDITGSTLMIDKGLYIDNDDYIRYRNKLRFIGNGNGKIKRTTAGGYMFSSTIRSGDIEFDNISFIGGAEMNGDDDHDSAQFAAATGVFDCSKLIRLTTIGCSYCLVGTVFDGHESISAATNTQTIRSYNDVVTYSNSLACLIYAWDCVFHGALIERVNYGFFAPEESETPFTYNGIVIDSCCIESTLRAIEFITAANSGNNVQQLTITNSYFESNGTKHIRIKPNNTSGLTISNCRFTLRNGAIGIELTNASLSTVIKNCYGIGNTGSYLINNLGAVLFAYHCKSESAPMFNSSSVINVPYNGMIPSYASAGQAGLVDCDLVTNYTQSVDVLSSESVSNSPSEFSGKAYNFISIGLPEISFQIAAQKDNVYFRGRTPGVGYSPWYSDKWTELAWTNGNNGGINGADRTIDDIDNYREIMFVICDTTNHIIGTSVCNVSAFKNAYIRVMGDTSDTTTPAFISAKCTYNSDTSITFSTPYTTGRLFLYAR